MNSHASHLRETMSRPPALQASPLLLSIGHSQMANQLVILEQKIVWAGEEKAAADLLNEYLDLGLDAALYAGQQKLLPLQESWLIRLYSTLRSAASNPATPAGWRKTCFDYLYQPFFALQSLYLATPGASYKLYRLRQEFSALDRILQL